MENTFGDYVFDEWVPMDVQGQIREFWGGAGRTYKDWLNNNQYEREHHFYGANGFGLPPNGALAYFYVSEYMQDKKYKKEIKGRYIHAWNNIGRLIHDDGSYTCVSSCDPWVRIYEKDSTR